MTYMIEMPEMGPTFQRFEVDEWFVAAGDSLAANEKVCSVTVNPDHRIDRLSWRERRALRKKQAVEFAVERAQVILIAREPGEVANVLVKPGAVIQPGDALAEVSIPAGGSGRFAVVTELAREQN